jgi:hypothetical protein
MTREEASTAIAYLADKMSTYHSRLMGVESENKQLKEKLETHLNGCSCHNGSEKLKETSEPEELGVIRGRETKAYIESLNEPEECEACGA